MNIEAVRLTPSEQGLIAHSALVAASIAVHAPLRLAKAKTDRSDIENRSRSLRCIMTIRAMMAIREIYAAFQAADRLYDWPTLRPFVINITANNMIYYATRDCVLERVARALRVSRSSVAAAYAKARFLVEVNCSEDCECPACLVHRQTPWSDRDLLPKFCKREKTRQGGGRSDPGTRRRLGPMPALPRPAHVWPFLLRFHCSVYDLGMLEVICSQCGLRILVPPSVQGRHGICFNCTQPLQIPSAANIARHLDLAFENGDRVAERYIIMDPIGKGGMGVVYRAHDTLMDENVALKFMKPSLLRTESGKRLFIQEAQIARRLRHDNIVAVHDVSWTSEGILYISMELCEGRSLRKFLHDQRRERRLLEVRLAVSFTRQILSALESAHKLVVHRDVKPENAMILSGERIKVLDFGLAKAVQEEMLDQPGAEAPSKTARVIGTLAYAAPEQIRKQKVDLRADLYAVGLVFYELLTLRTPLDEQVPLEKARPDLAPAVKAVLDKAVERDKEQRWQSAREFRKALDKAFRESYVETKRQIHISTKRENVSTEGMVFVEGGRFLMGNNDVREEAPEEEVRVEPFWMDLHPVTVAHFSEYLEETGNPPPKYWRHPQYNGPEQPVVGVTWAEAKAYAEWAGKRLPTEAQWEFAARGKENRRYPWGSLEPDSTLANYGEHIGMTSVVTMHDAGRTPEGIYDMAGNVLEWTLDPYEAYAIIRNFPQKAEEAPRRALRGGSWSSPSDELRATARKGLFPDTSLPTVGFRCVIPADEMSAG